MGLFSRRDPPPPNVGEPCDRCRNSGHVRVGKHIPIEYPGVPTAMDSRQLDLVFCQPDYARHERALLARNWLVLDDKRGQR